MLSLLLHTPIKNIAHFYLTFREESIEKKSDRLIHRGINDTFFIYAPNKELKHFWDLILKNESIERGRGVNIKFFIVLQLMFFDLI
jgi:hypothetical protein